MVITCEKCGKSFNLDEKLLKPGGTKLQCSKCKNIFLAFPPAQKKVPIAVQEKPSIEAPEVELIVCEKCAASFKMRSNLLKPEGSKVRCSKCKHIFLAFSSSSETEPEEKVKVEKPKPKVEKPKASQKDVKTKGREAVLDFSLEEESADDTVTFLDKPDLGIKEKPAAAEPSGSSGDLELELDEGEAGGDLELELDEGEAGGDLELDLEEGEAGGDLELDLEESPAAAEPSGSSGDLELELDEGEAGGELELDLEEKPAVKKPSKPSGVKKPKAEVDEGELDFSEVDNLLDAEDMSAADTVEVSAADLDLDLDSDDVGGKAGGSVEQQEIDLADLEQTIEMELLEPEENNGEEEPEDTELKLADDEGDADEAEELSLEGSEGEDFSDIEEMLAVGEDEETIELDLEGEEKEEQEATAEGEETVVKEKVKAVKKKKEKKVKEKKAKAAKGEGKSVKKILVVAAIILAVLIGLAVGGYFLSKTMGFPIESLFGKTAPAGNVSVIENTIQSDFVDNSAYGNKLFVVKGSVKNESSAPKSFIKVVANLYSEGHKLEMTSSAYCGNILSAEELATSDLGAISARLANKGGNNNINASVKPGMSIPFMIVIQQLPDNLKEYEVVVADSSPVS